jgi:hypothetical protein
VAASGWIRQSHFTQPNMNPSKPHCLRLTAALLGIAALGTAVHAAPVLVPDHSFEITEVADGATTAAPNVGTNWTASGNSGVILLNPQDDRFPNTTTETLPPGNLPAPADGTNCVNMNMGVNLGYLWQTVGTLQPNTVYTLTVAAGQDLINGGGVGNLVLVNGLNAFGTVLGLTPVDTTTNTPGTFGDITLTYVTGQVASGPLTILMRGESGTQIIWDNVRLDATAAPQAALARALSVSPTNLVFVGTQVTLTEDPAGAAPFTYGWESDNGSGGVTFSPIVGASSAGYVVDTTAFTPGQPVQYRVLVTNGFGVSTSAPVAITAINGPPVVKQDTLPVTGSDVEGSLVTFTASFEGTLPISYQWQRDGMDLPGANSPTLTINNLQLGDSGNYQLVATNSLGASVSTARFFQVNPTPIPEEGVLISVATQTGEGGQTSFSPTWVVSTNSLIRSNAPSAIGTGNFSRDSSGVVAVLTDGRYGTINPAGNGSLDFVTCGINNQGGAFVTYSLPVSATGYDVTNIVVYGGWSDGGRDQQRYVVSYSTVASPTVFNQIADVNYNPTLPGQVQSSTRITLTGTNGAAMAKNVSAIKFDFNILGNAVENQYAGYCEVGVAGLPSAPAPVIATNTTPTSAMDVEGSSVTFYAAFSSATPVTYQWRVDTGSGPVAIPGANSPTLTLNNLQFADAGSYSLLASNASGTAVSTPSPLTISPAPTPDGNGVLAAGATQTGNTPFRTTWSVPGGSLLSGKLPGTVGGGNFLIEGCGGLTRLTDGSVGSVGGAQNATLASAGPNAGTSVTYDLTGAVSGYDLTNIVIFSGWSDKGRDGQAYEILYATASDPNTFIALTSFAHNPSGLAVPTANRVTLTPSVGNLAVNVVRLRINFLNAENGWSGYSEIGAFGAPSSPVNVPPYLTEEVTPAGGSDVVGSSVIFKVTALGSAPLAYQWRKDTGSGPVDIIGATASSLTLNNLQLSDSATPGYSVVVSNEFGIVTSSAGAFTVNPVPAAVAGIIAAPAHQIGYSTAVLKPTWLMAGGSLIAGTLPSAVGSGNFGLEAAGGVSVLTDNSAGSSKGSNLGFATAGTGGGSGTAVTYTLSGSATGYNLDRIIVHAGWGDSGRDGQGYRIYYSTAAAPATFIPLRTNSLNPVIAGGVPTANRVTLYAESGPIAQGVAQLRLEFLNVENGWSGYSEIAVFGVPAAGASISVTSRADGSGNLILTGNGGTPGAGYSWLTATNVASPIALWTTNSAGVFDGTGAFSNAIPVSKLEPTRYFRLKTP